MDSIKANKDHSKSQILNLNFSLFKKGIKNIKISKEDKNSLFKNIDIDKEIFQLLKKTPSARTTKEVQEITEYLSKNYNYFSELKEGNTMNKLENIAKLCRLEFISKDSYITRFGENIYKFFLVLEGMVEVFKPNYIEINEIAKNFLFSLEKIKEEDGGNLKYKRIINKNISFFNVTSEEINIKNSINQDKKYNFFMEINEKIGEYGKDFSFGDITLTNKTESTSTIKAKTNCILLIINNDEYNRTILNIQRKKMSLVIDNFTKTYSIFSNLGSDLILKLFNWSTKLVLHKGDYLYKQNMESNSIYLLEKGILDAYSTISFPWINDYIDYIDYSEKNILKNLIEDRNTKLNDLMKIISEFRDKNQKNNKESKKNDILFKINEMQVKDNIYKLKRDEEKLNSSDNFFNLYLKKVDYKSVIGLVEIFEFKKRFCSFKCVSEKAELKKIKLADLLRLISNFTKDELCSLQRIIQEKKHLLKIQIVKSIQNLDKKLIVNFDSRYENLIGSKNFENDEEQSDILFSFLKLKGYKTTIKDILDRNLNLFEKKVNITPKYILKKLNRKNKSSEDLISKFHSQRSSPNEFKFNKKKINIKLLFQKPDNILYNLSNNYQNSTPFSLKISKKYESTFYSFNNSSKISRNKIIPFNEPKTFSKRNNINIINNINNNKKFDKLEINKKLLSTTLIFSNNYLPKIVSESPIIKNINLSKKINELNKYDTDNNQNPSKKIKEYNGFNKNNTLFDKKIFMGKRFLNKFNDKYNDYKIKI